MKQLLRERLWGGDCFAQDAGLAKEEGLFDQAEFICSSNRTKQSDRSETPTSAALFHQRLHHTTFDHPQNVALRLLRSRLVGQLVHQRAHQVDAPAADAHLSRRQLRHRFQIKRFALIRKGQNAMFATVLAHVDGSQFAQFQSGLAEVRRMRLDGFRFICDG